MPKIAKVLLICSLMSNACVPYIKTAKLKVNATPIRFVDAATEGGIPEILVIPQYVSNIEHVSAPFIYRKGDSFSPIEYKANGVTWIPGCAFTGWEKLMKGALAVAPGYKPRWLSTSMLEVSNGNLGLLPISVSESVQTMSDLLDQIEKGSLQMPDECSRYYLSPCLLKVRFNKKELEVVRSFLKNTAK